MNFPTSFHVVSALLVDRVNRFVVEIGIGIGIRFRGGWVSLSGGFRARVEMDGEGLVLGVLACLTYRLRVILELEQPACCDCSGSGWMVVLKKLKRVVRRDLRASTVEKRKVLKGDVVGLAPVKGPSGRVLMIAAP